MHILHYTLGLPPFRTGGLTKYSHDLMISEESMGNKVSLLYPGYMTLSDNAKIIKNSKYNNMDIYELVNSLPVTLMSGVKNPEEYFKKKINKKLIYDFFNSIKPDIIHIHTLMGIYKEFIEVAAEYKIPIIYSTHDYFGICPKVNLLTYNKDNCNNEIYKEGNTCIYCNNYGYSKKLIYLMQSKTYRRFKYSGLGEILRKYKVNKIKSNLEYDDIVIDSKDVLYVDFRNYYLGILKRIDFFHFNSSVAKNVYNSYLNCKGEVIHITHKNISDNRRIKEFGGKLRITYIGPTDEYKGFNLLIDSINKLKTSGLSNWRLNIFGDNGYSENLENIYFNGKYDYEKLPYIFDKTDVLIIPSIWKETFGFIGLEAISYGVPVIVTNNVGFKDIVEKNDIGIVTDADSGIIAKHLIDLAKNTEILSKFNENINSMNFNFDMNTHSRNMCDLYKRIIESR